MRQRMSDFAGSRGNRRQGSARVLVSGEMDNPCVRVEMIAGSGDLHPDIAKSRAVEQRPAASLVARGKSSSSWL